MDETDKEVDDSIHSNILYYENRELELLKNAMNIEAKKRGERIAQNPIMKQIINVLEKFIRDKKLVCYGGTAINNILPESEQFYKRNLEIPDYDFFSSNAINDAKELADIYFRQGFSDVEAKAGVHYGTYKVFVNFFQIADITQLDSKLFSSLKKNALLKDGMLYSPPNFLRMAMYLELSRPGGDITRWEKVFKRLNILNRHYPLKATNCDPETFKHSLSARSYNKQFQNEKEKIQTIIKNIASKEKLVFIGGYANILYSRYLHNNERAYLEEIPDFDLLSNTPDKTAKAIKESLEKQDIRNITIETKAAIPDYLSTHFEVRVGSQPVAYVYKPLACHSYNSIKVKGKIFRVATIDTMMSFYLLFLYADRPYYNPRRTLCLCEYLFKIQQKNRLKQTGLLRRFSITCYGKQKTIEDIRNEKAKQYKRLKTKKKSKEYHRWFLRYNPELNPENKPFIVQSKTREDIINEAKLALEAKILTSKAVIEGIGDIQKIDKLKKKNIVPTPSPMSPIRSRSSFSRVKTNKLNNRKNISARLSMRSPKTRKNKQVENLLFVEDNFTPSNM
jgi:Poly(A) polymerase catalytic subunit